MAFSWKKQLKRAERKLKARIIVLEKAGDTFRAREVKFRLERIMKKDG